MNDTSLMKKVDSNTTPDSSDICNSEFKDDQNADNHESEHVVLADLIANLKIDIDENKKIQKQLKKANASLTQELKECKSTLEETNRTLRESNSTRDSCLIALQNKEIELEKCKTYLNHTTEYDTLEHLQYVQLLEKEIDELESDKADFSNIYDLLLQECVSKDVICSYLHSLSDSNAHTELQCLYLHKVKEHECLTEKLSKQTENIVQLILFIVDFGCTKHIMGNLKLLCNFVKKYMGTVRFGNDQFAPILGYGDVVQGNIMIKRVYYVKSLNHNLFSIGQFCDADLEVAFRKSTCFMRDLQGNDLLLGNRGSDLYTISLQETFLPTPICFLAKASPTQA
ncbi:hypothetical protein Tco_0807359 [Tanacetum coccineum]